MPNDQKITVTTTKSFEYSKDDLVDIISCCMPGSNYWSCLGNDSEEWAATRVRLKMRNIEAGQEDPRPCYEDIIVEMLLTHTTLLIYELDEDEIADQSHFFTLEGLIEGIKQTIEQGYWNGDLDDLDAAVGDIILQFSVLGEVVYG